MTLDEKIKLVIGWVQTTEQLNTFPYAMLSMNLAGETTIFAIQKFSIDEMILHLRKLQHQLEQLKTNEEAKKKLIIHGN